jgi:hypothetical protein
VNAHRVGAYCDGACSTHAVSITAIFCICPSERLQRIDNDEKVQPNFLDEKKANSLPLNTKDNKDDSKRKRRQSRDRTTKDGDLQKRLQNAKVPRSSLHRQDVLPMSILKKYIYI